MTPLALEHRQHPARDADDSNDTPIKDFLVSRGANSHCPEIISAVAAIAVNWTAAFDPLFTRGAHRVMGNVKRITERGSFLTDVR